MFIHSLFFEYLSCLCRLQLDPANESEVHAVRQFFVYRVNAEAHLVEAGFTRCCFQFEEQFGAFFFHQLELFCSQQFQLMIIRILFRNDHFDT